MWRKPNWEQMMRFTEGIKLEPAMYQTAVRDEKCRLSVTEPLASSKQIREEGVANQVIDNVSVNK
jgi:hypothetical protein